MELRQYLIIKLYKPINNLSRISGKVVPIKNWVKLKNNDEGELVFSSPVLETCIFSHEKYYVFYVRNHKEFNETFKRFKENCHEKF